MIAGIRSSQDYSWMVNKGLLVPRDQMRQAQTRLQSWQAQTPSHLKDRSRLQEDNLRSPQDDSWLMRASLSRGPENTRPRWDSGGPASNRQHLREASSACISLRAWGPEWCSTKATFFPLYGGLISNKWKKGGASVEHHSGPQAGRDMQSLSQVLPVTGWPSLEAVLP